MLKVGGTKVKEREGQHLSVRKDGKVKINANNRIGYFLSFSHLSVSVFFLESLGASSQV